MIPYRIHALSLSFAALIAAGSASAQSFVNGSLEPVAGTTPCQYVYNNVFYTTMNSGGYAFGNTAIGGTVGKIYLNDVSCNDGPAQAGAHFLALSSNNTQEDAMSLKLTASLQANKAYKLSFYTKKSKVLVSIGLELGYTTDSMAFGTSIGTLPAPTDTLWKLQSFTFTPTTSTRYITIRGVRTTVIGYSFTPVDNFSIAAVSGTGVGLPAVSFTAAPHPNPFRASLGFTLGANVAMPCRITLRDITGKMVYERTTTDRHQEIARENISAGIYLLTVHDADGNASFTRVAAE